METRDSGKHNKRQIVDVPTEEKRPKANTSTELHLDEATSKEKEQKKAELFELAKFFQEDPTVANEIAAIFDKDTDTLSQACWAELSTKMMIGSTFFF